MRPKSHQDVVKSNALIEAIHKPGSVYQMRLFLAALIQVKAKEPVDSDEIYSISASRLSELTGNKTVDNYHELEKAADQLSNTSIRLTTDYQGKPISKRGWLKINLVSSCCYKPQEGRVELRFTKEIIPYISELTRRFTRYEPKHVMPMRSSYGIRLYELCLQWLGEERAFTVDGFKDLFELGGQYGRLGNLKKRVIEPALKDINTYSDIRVTLSQRKAGRQVTHFVFNIEKPKKETQAEPLDFEAWVTHFDLAKGKGFNTWGEARKKLGRTYSAYCKDPLKWSQKHGSEADYQRMLEAQGQRRLAI